MFYNRKNLRAPFYNYSEGDFFVTACVQDKQHLFGRIVNGEMSLTEIGAYCMSQIEEIPQHYKYAEILNYVIMPNHLHLIVRLDPKTAESKGCKIPKMRTLLGVVMGGFKRAVTLYARRNTIYFGWQGRFHDHYIRNAVEGQRIWSYIDNNAANWDSDCFYTTV